MKKLSGSSSLIHRSHAIRLATRSLACFRLFASLRNIHQAQRAQKARAHNICPSLGHPYRSSPIRDDCAIVALTRSALRATRPAASDHTGAPRRAIATISKRATLCSQPYGGSEDRLGILFIVEWFFDTFPNTFDNGILLGSCSRRDNGSPYISLD